MESNNNHQLKVGIFLTTGIILLLLSIFMLGADKALFKSYVEMNVQFESVQGLNSGSVVSLSGLVIGNVDDIQFESTQNLINVRIKIEKQYQTKLTEGSQAEIRTQGALGDKFVYIIPGPSGGKVLESGSLLPVAKASDLIGIISERGKETDKIFDIINEVYKTTHTLNADGRLERIMQNLSAASQNLKDTSLEAKNLAADMNQRKTSEKIVQSIDKMDRILTKIDKGEGTLGALINDPTIHNQLKGVLGSSQRKSHIKTLLRTSIEEE